jgi:metacaspase-1
MNLDASAIEQKYADQLRILDAHVYQLQQRIHQWRMPTYARQSYLRSIQRRYMAQKASIQQRKMSELQRLHQQYSKASNRRKQACLIGINYEGSDYALRGCINDVKKLHQLLVSQYGYHPSDVRTVLNQQATRKTILREFTQLVANAVAGDTIFFSFSGHGYHMPDRDYDEADGRDELIVTADFQPIVDDELRAIVQTYLRSGVKLFALFDNCHSGTIFDLRYQYAADASSLKVDEIYKDSPSQVICLSGCMDAQVSMDAYLGNQFNGALTWALVDLLSSEKGLTWKACLEKIRAKLGERNFEQIPQLSCGIAMDLEKETVSL